MSTIPTNPPANPVSGAVYIDTVTNTSYVYTGAGWIATSGSTGYSSQITTGAAILPGYFAEPSPESFTTQVGGQPTNPGEGQIWVDDTNASSPSPVYVWHSSAWVKIADGTFTDTTVSTMPPANPDIGDSYYETTTNRFYVWDGATWQNVTDTADTHSIASALQPATRSDSSSLQAGDMWVNTNTGGVSYWNGSWFPIASAGSSSTVATAFFLASFSPVVGAEGDCYYNTTEDTLYVSNGTTWVPISDTNTAVSTTQPAATSVLWVDTSTGVGNEVLKYYDPGTTSWLPVATTSGGSDTQGYAAAGDPNSTAPYNTTTDSNGRSFATGDNYIDTATNAMYYRNGAAWVTVAAGGSDTQGYTAAGNPSSTAPYNTATDSSGRSFVSGDNYADSDTNLMYYRLGSDWAAVATGSVTATPTTRGSMFGSATVSSNGNVYLGENAGLANSGFSNSSNIFIGAEAGRANIGVGNVFIGAGNGGSTGAAQANVCIGAGTASSMATGNDNVHIGNSAGGSITSSSGNVLIGRAAGAGMASGGANIFIGLSSGSDVTTGGNNVIIGGYTGGISTLSDTIVIGRPIDAATKVLEINENNAFGFPSSNQVTNNTVDFGAANQVLTSQGSSNPPTWTTPVTGLLGETNGVNSTHTVPKFNTIVDVGGTTTTSVVITMGSSTANQADSFVVFDAEGNAGANSITVTLANFQFHDGTSSKIINTNYGRLTAYFSVNTSKFWFKID